MLKFGASKPRVKGGGPGPWVPLDPHLIGFHYEDRTQNEKFSWVSWFKAIIIWIDSIHRDSLVLN